MPEVIDGETVYRMTPEEFAAEADWLLEAGAGIVGGCCGTTPEHIRAFKEAAKAYPVPEVSQTYKRVLASERQTLEIGLDAGFKIVGERINPTGKKKLQAAFGKARWIWSWIWRWLRKRKVHRFWMSIWV